MTASVLSRRQRVRAAVIAAVLSPVIRALGLTYRWRVEGFSHYEAIRAAGAQPIFTSWHGRILPATYFWRGRGIVVMTSANFDGEWIARIIEHFGYGAARGSTSRGGARAMVQLRREMRAGRPAGFTVDGPRGPARSVQPGAVWLASLTGSPILPFHIEATRGWTIRSWDRTLVPKPFSRVGVVIGEPITVPRHADEASLESYRSTLERRMSALSDRAKELVTR